MLNYSDEQVKSIIENIAGAGCRWITPIGNHELMRHLVYLVNVKGSDPCKDTFIFKLYYKKNRRNREIAALNLLEGSGVKCPEILKHGILDDGTEWIICSYIEGIPFDKAIDSIGFENQLGVFEEMGRELGKIHSYKTFDFFGNWDEKGRSVDCIKDYIVNFIISLEYCIRDILSQDLPEEEQLKKTIIKVRNNYRIIDCIKESRLCHNDFDGRNILVKRSGESWALEGVIDFEQSIPGNIEIDIAGLYHKYFLNSSEFERAFFKGYENYMKLPEQFYDRLNFYLLCRGLNICSWAYKLAPDYYKEGLKLISMFYN